MSNRSAQWKYRCALHLSLRTFGSNDYLGVIKSIIGELTDSTNRTQGYALLPAVWCFGATIGFVSNHLFIYFCWRTSRPLIGGSLSHPYERFSKTFSASFWKDYPYFLPCLVSSAYVLFAIVIAFVMLKEVGVPILHYLSISIYDRVIPDTTQAKFASFFAWMSRWSKGPFTW